MGSTWQNEMWQAQEAHITIVQGTQIKLQISQEQKATKKKKNQVIVAKNAWEMKRKCKKENNNGIARVPPTYNPANAWELGPMAREITKRMVWWKGEKSLVSVSRQDLFWEMLC